MSTDPEYRRSILDAFDAHTVWHGHLQHAYEDTLRAIELAAGDGRITFVIGVSGVGKERLARMLRIGLRNHEGRGPVYVEVASGSATAPVSMHLVKDLILQELGEPPGTFVITTSRIPPGMPSHLKGPQRAKFLAICNLLDLLRPPALLLDEAQYLVFKLNELRKLTNLREFSSLANRKATPIVMIGTPDLLPAIALVNDLHRRIRLVVFRRHAAAGDMDDLVAGLNSYDTFLQSRGLLAEGFTLGSARERLYLASCGLFGNIHNLVYEALHDALAAGRGLCLQDFDRAEAGLIPDREKFKARLMADEARLGCLGLSRQSGPIGSSTVSHQPTQTDPAAVADVGAATMPTEHDGIADVPASGSQRRARKSRALPVGEGRQIRMPCGEGRALAPRAVLR